LFLLGFISKRTGKIEAATGVIAGVMLIIWMSLSPVCITEGKLLVFRSPFHSNLTIVFGTITIFLVGFVMSKVIHRN